MNKLWRNKLPTIEDRDLSEIINDVRYVTFYVWGTGVSRLTDNLLNLFVGKVI